MRMLFVSECRCHDIDIGIHLLYECWNLFLDKTQIALNYFNLKSIKILDVGAKKLPFLNLS